MKKLKFILLLIVVAFLTRVVIVNFVHGNQEQVEKEEIVKNDLLKQKVLYEAGSNYLDSVFYGGKIVRWNKAEFPLRIYIEDLPSMPNYYSKAFETAAKVWEDESEKIVTVDFVDNEDDANIVFKTAEREKNIREVELDETTTLAYTKPIFDGNKLKKTEIIFFEKDTDGKMVKPYEVLNIAVHEFGHALGLWGHSNDKNSVMYAFFDAKHQKQGSFLNKQDKTTLRLLYMVTPDITNGDKKQEKDTIAASILTGSMDERTDASIECAKKEAEMKKGDCMSRLNLAALYEQKNDYETMFQYLKEAEPLAKTDDEMYGVYVGYALYYAYKKDKTKALQYANGAVDIKNSKEANQLLDFIKSL